MARVNRKHPAPGSLCRTAADLTEVSGASVTMLSDTGSQSRVCVSGDIPGRLEELHFILGEGPCLDAYRQDRPVLEPDLADPETPRWVGFTAPAVGLGARAMFAFPVHIGTERLGVLALYRDLPGPLSDRQYDCALSMAEVAGLALFDMQTDAAPGAIPLELVAGVQVRAVVHQAAGMISAQLEVSVAEALARLRSYAFVNDHPLTEAARQVVERTLRFSPTD